MSQDPEKSYKWEIIISMTSAVTTKPHCRSVLTAKNCHWTFDSALKNRGRWFYVRWLLSSWIQPPCCRPRAFFQSIIMFPNHVSLQRTALSMVLNPEDKTWDRLYCSHSPHHPPTNWEHFHKKHLSVSPISKSFKEQAYVFSHFGYCF